MNGPDYSAAGISVRDDLRRCHAFLLRHVTSSGTWWNGAERRAIAAETRQAVDCRLCVQRKAVLSHAAVKGRHDNLGALPDAVVDIIHRIRTDPARLSRQWFDGIVPAVLPDTHYVELVGVVTMMAGMDNFARAFGVPAFALPAASPGEPSRHRSAAKPAGAWVPMLAPEDAGGIDADVYPQAPFIPNIIRALSLVPDQVRALCVSSDAHYLPAAQIGDPSVRRSIDRMQMELVAGRVSALNECFY
jgi:hypothetical protein